MSETELADYTPRAFFNKWRGFNQLQEYQYQREWERTRWLGMLVAAPYTKSPVSDPKEFMPFEWEKEGDSTKKPLTREEVDAIFGKWEK